jgi:glycerol-3-phosphate dehydrogenase
MEVGQRSSEREEDLFRNSSTSIVHVTVSFALRSIGGLFAEAKSSILLPIYTWWQLPYYYAGCKLYDILAGPENMESAYWMGKGKAIEAFPMLKSEGLVGGVVYYDGKFDSSWFRPNPAADILMVSGQHNDSRMNISLVMTAVQHGAVMTNHTEVTKLHKKMDPKKGTERICAATVRDRMTGEEWVVRCRVRQGAVTLNTY